MNKEQTIEQVVPCVIDIVIPAYNARKTIQKTVKATLIQELPANWEKNVIIVDDGSSDDTVQYCQTVFNKQVKVIVHKQNRGRAASRNTGWHAGFGKYVVFLDADCRWSSTKALSAHIQVLDAGSDVSTGAIISNKQNFWGNYQNMIQKSREQDFLYGNLAVFTSANLAIKRTFLEKSNGFDESYRHYGFEDRDFLLRLISLGAKINFCSDAVIIHNPDSSLVVLCKKMMESGQYSAARFREAHPDYYGRSIYGRVDCRLHGFPLTLLAMIASPMLFCIVYLNNIIIEFSWVPYQIKNLLVKITSGLAYMSGTYRGTKNR